MLESLRYRRVGIAAVPLTCTGDRPSTHLKRRPGCLRACAVRVNIAESHFRQSSSASEASQLSAQTFEGSATSKRKVVDDAAKAQTDARGSPPFPRRRDWSCLLRVCLSRRDKTLWRSGMVRQQEGSTTVKSMARRAGSPSVFLLVRFKTYPLAGLKLSFSSDDLLIRGRCREQIEYADAVGYWQIHYTKDGKRWHHGLGEKAYGPALDDISAAHFDRAGYPEDLFSASGDWAFYMVTWIADGESCTLSATAS